MQTAVGQFAIGVGGVGTTVSVTGLPFQPKVVLFSWSGRTAVGQSEATHKFGMGFMVSATERGGATTTSGDDFAIAGCKNRSFSDACIKIIEPLNNTVEGAADFDAFLVDGFRVIIDDQFPSSFLINYLAIGGDDLTNVKAVTIRPPDVDGDQDTTTVGFKPDCAIFIGSEPATSGGGWSLGAAAQDPPVNAVLNGVGIDGGTTSETKSYCRLGDECYALRPNPGTQNMQHRGKVTSWLSNGFRMSWLDTTVLDEPIQVLCLKGGTYKVGDILTATNTTQFSETGVGFVPRALIFASHNKAQSAADTSQATDERTVGFAKSATERASVGCLDKNAVGTTDVGTAQHTDNCYSNQSTAAAIAVEGLMDLVSMDADGFTVVMDDADPAQSFVWYLALGDGPAPPPPSSPGGANRARALALSTAILAEFRRQQLAGPLQKRTPPRLFF